MAVRSSLATACRRSDIGDTVDCFRIDLPDLGAVVEVLHDTRFPLRAIRVPAGVAARQAGAGAFTSWRWVNVVTGLPESSSCRWCRSRWRSCATGSRVRANPASSRLSGIPARWAKPREGTRAIRRTRRCSQSRSAPAGHRRDWTPPAPLCLRRWWIRRWHVALSPAGRDTRYLVGRHSPTTSTRSTPARYAGALPAWCPQRGV